MVFSSNNLENELLETTAGVNVYDALVQANVNLKTVSVELVKQMLLEECKFLRTCGRVDSADLLVSC